MKILIAVASKHGSTREIAGALAQELEKQRHDVAVHAAQRSLAVDGYDAALVGSAVYVGNWMGEARAFVAENQAALARIPVWLFSSGPLGAENPQPEADPAGMDELMAQTGARGHQIFVGKLDKSALGLGERLIVRGVRAPYGDFRDWDAIRAWGQTIARELAEPVLA